MVDKNLLRSIIVLKGYSQKSLAAEMTLRGSKISETSLSSKMSGKSTFNCDEADLICDILNITKPETKAKIFLLNQSQKRDESSPEVEF